jgi:hypothetical protein
LLPHCPNGYQCTSQEGSDRRSYEVRGTGLTRAAHGDGSRLHGRRAQRRLGALRVHCHRSSPSSLMSTWGHLDRLNRGVVLHVPCRLAPVTGLPAFSGWSSALDVVRHRYSFSRWCSYSSAVRSCCLRSDEGSFGASHGPPSVEPEALFESLGLREGSRAIASPGSGPVGPARSARTASPVSRCLSATTTEQERAECSMRGGSPTGCIANGVCDVNPNGQQPHRAGATLWTSGHDARQCRRGCLSVPLDGLVPQLAAPSRWPAVLVRPPAASWTASEGVFKVSEQLGTRLHLDHGPHKDTLSPWRSDRWAVKGG